jgi:hypothetical protein
MTRAELEHAIRAACVVARDTEVIVFGSQSILGQHPDAPASLRQSAEADIMPKNRPEAVDALDGALGELSPFHAAHGFYVHGVHIDSATLPQGWERRCVIIKNQNTNGYIGHCLDGYDLAASKLAAFRDKDREFVRNLMMHGLIRGTKLVRNLNLLPLADEKRARLITWVERTERELATDGAGSPA